eukprot:2241900-Alexandrium_andersonii.AAC.1
MHDQDRGGDTQHLGTGARLAVGGHRLYFALRAVAQKLSDRAEVEARAAAAGRRKAFRERVQDGKRGLGEAYKALRPMKARGVFCVQDAEGKVCVQPQQVDQAMRQAWGEVTAAKGRTPADAVAFCERYSKYL